jgi:FixJ family two-component response regulator
VVFLSGQANVPDSVEGMKGGAVDFLTKPVDEHALLAAVTEALDHHRRVLEQSRMVRSFEDHLAQLTPREFEVLREVITGRLNKQIAARLGIAEKTVKVHRGRVMAKLTVSSVAELVRLCSAGGVNPASRAGDSAREQPSVDRARHSRTRTKVP